MTSQNQVPFNYRKSRKRASVNEQDDPVSEQDENSEEEADEQDDEDDVVIEVHRSMEKSVKARRRMEGLYLNEHQCVVEKKEYNVLAMLKHANPLRRPILFVKASGMFDKTAQPQEPPAQEAPEPNPAPQSVPPPKLASPPQPSPSHQPISPKPAPTSQTPSPPGPPPRAGPPVRSSKHSKHTGSDWTDDFLSLRLADQILESDGRRPVSEQDAILADWLENAMMGDMLDVPDMPGVLTDPLGPATTLEDIAIDAHEREQAAWESESEDSDATDDNDNDDTDESALGNWHATMLQRVRVPLAEESDDRSAPIGSEPDAFLSDHGRAKAPRMPPRLDDTPWAEELQTQWEKDRSRKASKKKQREAARQAASFDPFPNTHGHARTSKKSKKQRKQETRERRAALKALADDDDAPAVLAPPDSFAEINEWIVRFLSDSEHTTLTLPPMRKRDRAMVHNMADAYALKSKSRGSGSSRCPILYKTSRTGSNVDHKRVARLVNSPFGTMDDETFDHRGLGRSGRVRLEVAPRHREGAQVGGGAKQISEDNIGHQLLRSMGWSSGEGLGQSKGRAEPVMATVKMSRSGLGL